MPGVHTLELQLSGRGDRHEVDTGTSSARTTYNATPVATTYVGPTQNGQPYFSKADYTSSNYTIALKYQPVNGVTLRASRATAFLPPTPSQLVKNPAPNPNTTSIIDPQTGARTDVYTLRGGNPDLKPQNSKSLNAGLILEPTWKLLQGLRLNAEYYKIEQFDYITALGAQQIVDQASIYPNRVTRDASGVITLVDISSVNLYHRETEGLDLGVSYTHKVGTSEITLNGVHTTILHLKDQYSQTQPEYDAAGYSPGEGGAPKYKSNASLTWLWRNLTAGWTTRYFGSYKQYGAAGGPLSIRSFGGAASGNYIPAQGGDTIGSQTYHDAIVSYTFGQRSGGAGSQLKAKLLGGLSVQLGVRNIFNKAPALDTYHSSNYYLSPYGDMRFRSYWLTVKKSF